MPSAARFAAALALFAAMAAAVAVLLVTTHADGVRAHDALASAGTTSPSDLTWG